MTASLVHTDANAIAGLLREIFAGEATAAERRCQSCAEQRPIGAHRLYRGAGLVLRCPHCGDLAAIIATLPGRYVIRTHGTWSIDRR